MAAYMLLPVAFFLIGSVFVGFFRRARVYQVYTYILLFLFLLIIVCDLQVFQQWGFRIDATILKYLSSPKEAWASISHLPVFLYLLLFALAYWLLIRTTGRLLKQAMPWLQKRVSPLLAVPILLLCAAVLMLPIRGGLQQTPMNQSSVYFSTNNFANQAAINAPWNFLYGVFSETASSSNSNPYTYLSADRANKIVDSLYSSAGDVNKVLKSTRPNVLLIVWESFTEKATHVTIDGREVTPYFNQMKKEGIYFSNAYASGDRTDKGLPAILSGYPALPQSSIIRLPNKASKLSSISGVLKQQGYSTSFYYGGEPEFANIKSYLLHAGFDPIVEKKDFAARDLNSKWGAHDGVVATRLLQGLNKATKPFFATWLTLSSHEPFETPVPAVIKGSDDTHKFLNSLNYTDDVLFHFIEQCKQQSWWNNTLIVIVADHGHPLPETGNRIDNFKIPILWLGGALKEKGVVIDKVVSQLDIAATLCTQLGLPTSDFPLSKNSLGQNTLPWAFFSFNNGFGFAQPQSVYLYDNVGKRIITQTGIATPQQVQAGQALQQHTYADYLGK